MCTWYAFLLRTHLNISLSNGRVTHTLTSITPVSLKSRTHTCSFVCCEGLKNVFNTGENIFIQTFTGLCKGFIKKTRRHKPQTFSMLNSGQDKNLLLFHFWFSQHSSFYIVTGRKLTVCEGASNSKQNPAGHRPIGKKL